MPGSKAVVIVTVGLPRYSSEVLGIEADSCPPQELTTGARGDVAGVLLSLLSVLLLLLSSDKIRWISTEAGLAFLPSLLSACSGLLAAGWVMRRQMASISFAGMLSCCGSDDSADPASSSLFGSYC